MGTITWERGSRQRQQQLLLQFSFSFFFSEPTANNPIGSWCDIIFQSCLVLLASFCWIKIRLERFASLKSGAHCFIHIWSLCQKKWHLSPTIRNWTIKIINNTIQYIQNHQHLLKKATRNHLHTKNLPKSIYFCPWEEDSRKGAALSGVPNFGSSHKGKILYTSAWKKE